MHHIQTYYRELDDLRRIAGERNESVVRAAFQNLLKNIAEEHQLILVNEYPVKKSSGLIRVDGALIDRLRLVHGWWEAKDEQDVLDVEIAAKLAKGYPSDNIIFEDTRTAVLLQGHEEISRCKIEQAKSFEKLLTQFFEYELPEVQNFRLARDKFLTELPDVSVALTQLLAQAHGENLQFNQQAQKFLALCQRSIGRNVTLQHLDEMLIQHILTDQVFRAVFPHSNFHRENHLAVAIGQLEDKFLRGETRMNLLKRLEPYFAAIRQAAASTVTSHEKQTFLKQVYEDFYTAYNPKDADKLGIVYTPQEAVRFIISGCDWLSQRHFDKYLIDKQVDILDPCTGTGTFIVDLLDFWRGQKKALINKFLHELHANEISILSYYIACLNIEQTFYEITEQWQEFKGLCFVNTLENLGFERVHEGATDDLFGSLTDENHSRIQSQNQRKIPVIIGNPPYNANQQNENDNNKNDIAVAIDQRIKDTYLSESTAQKTKLYDPYVRFFRWASDRLGQQGILGFITNRSFLDKRSFDGFRKVVTQEFQEIWIVDLLGDLRDKSEVSLDQGGNIFNIQTGVAISFFVRNPQINGCKIQYIHAPEGMSGVEKLRWLKSNYLEKLARTGQVELIRPNSQNLWLNQPTEDWSHFLPIASKEVKTGKSNEAIFKLHSLGVVTNRDEWVYGLTEQEVSQKVNFLIDVYEKKRTEPCSVESDIKWTRAVKNDLSKNVAYSFDRDYLVDSMYRPFTKRKLYFNQQLNEMQYKQRDVFGYNSTRYQNSVICFTDTAGRSSFSSLAVDKIVDLHFAAASDGFQTLPLYVYRDGTREENITDWALKQFREHYQQPTIQKIDIFHYVYAVLHDPRYREKFALNLKQEFPRIPFHPQFNQWVEKGRRLMQLHIEFEQVEPYPLTRVEIAAGKNNQTRLKADKIQNLIEIDSQTQLSGIPEIAWQYQLGNRSALEWVLDQYKEKTPKDATIREKFNTYRFADHKEQVIELLKKVCHVSVETMRIIQEIQD
jgi:predicted helicase